MTNINIYQLSFLGDSVFDLLVRKYLIDIGVLKLNDLQNKSLLFVSAKRQAYFVKYLTDNNLLNEEEIELIRKGRNIKTHKSPKNCDIITYKYATGFEVMVGYLYLYNKKRLEELFEIIVNIK